MAQNMTYYSHAAALTHNSSAQKTCAKIHSTAYKRNVEVVTPQTCNITCGQINAWPTLHEDKSTPDQHYMWTNQRLTNITCGQINAWPTLHVDKSSPDQHYMRTNQRLTNPLTKRETAIYPISHFDVKI